LEAVMDTICAASQLAISLNETFQLLFKMLCATCTGCFSNKGVSSKHQQQWEYLLGYSQGAVESCIDYFKGEDLHLYISSFILLGLLVFFAFCLVHWFNGCLKSYWSDEQHLCSVA
jgi:hypothetical protein